MTKIPVIALIVGASVLLAQSATRKSPVRDPETAIQIAEAALLPVYGQQQIESERPFHARSNGPDWLVMGTLHCPDGKGRTTDLCLGGAATVRVAKSDGRIVSMTHYK